MAKRRRRIEVSAEASCETNCAPSACCKGPTWLDVDRKELGFMTRGGNELISIAPIEDRDRSVQTPIVMSTKTGRVKAELDVVPAGKGRFVMPRDCTYLKPDENGNQSCSAYEERPYACQKYEMGGRSCRIVRQLFEVDPIELGGEAEEILRLRAELDQPSGPETLTLGTL